MPSTAAIWDVSAPRDRAAESAKAVSTDSTVVSAVDHAAVDDAAPDDAAVIVLPGVREVPVGQRSIPFTRLEFDLLRFLAEHPRQVFSREQLLARVWGFARGGHRTVDVHIRRLPAKVPGRS
jgi:DNA-binding response OmpR family regulator